MDSMSVGVVPNDIFASPGQRLHVLTGQHLYIILKVASLQFFICVFVTVLRIRIRLIHMFLGLLDPYL
jgi:hypothetical protein